MSHWFLTTLAALTITLMTLEEESSFFLQLLQPLLWGQILAKPLRRNPSARGCWSDCFCPTTQQRGSEKDERGLKKMRGVGLKEPTLEVAVNWLIDQMSKHYEVCPTQGDISSGETSLS